MVRAVVGGRDFNLTKAEVETKMNGIEPEPIREHFVFIGGMSFPPKQALAQVTGWNRQTFTTLEATRVLGRIGFQCHRRTDGRVSWDPAEAEDQTGQTESSGQRDATPDDRLSALESAMTVIQEATASLIERVRELERAGGA